MISIIIPIYNVEKYLEQCINSIINQTYKDLQIILVDDGSPDGCSHICDRYSKLDNRICVIHKKNGGLSDARNAGLNIATGDYIGFVDGDDYINPYMYEILLNNLMRFEADISVCGFQHLNESDKPLPYEQGCIQVFEGRDILYQLYENNLMTVVAWNKLYKRSIFNGLRYETGRIHEDEFIIHKLLNNAKRTVYADCKLYYYVNRKNSIVNGKNIKRIRDTWDALEDRCLFFNKIDEKLYSFTRFQQLSFISKNYYLYKKGSIDERQLMNHLFLKCKKIKAEKKIWRYSSARFSRDMTFFVTAPTIYYFLRYVLLKNS